MNPKTTPVAERHFSPAQVAWLDANARYDKVISILTKFARALPWEAAFDECSDRLEAKEEELGTEGLKAALREAENGLLDWSFEIARCAPGFRAASPTVRALYERARTSFPVRERLVAEAMKINLSPEAETALRRGTARSRRRALA